MATDFDVPPKVLQAVKALSDAYFSHDASISQVLRTRVGHIVGKNDNKLVSAVLVKAHVGNSNVESFIVNVFTYDLSEAGNVVYTSIKSVYQKVFSDLEDAVTCFYSIEAKLDVRILINKTIEHLPDLKCSFDTFYDTTFDFRAYINKSILIDSNIVYEALKGVDNG